MKLNFWNWVHLLTPYLGSWYLHAELGESYLGWLFTCYLFTFLITMIPHMDRDVKTGRSFRTKHGTINEYRTEHGEPISSEIKGYINASHFIGGVLLIIYAGYSIFSK
jgi:hypothetical protein